MQIRPTIALAMGDPAGISPELTAKVLALGELRSCARFVVVGDRRVLTEGEKLAGVQLDLHTVGPESNLPEDEQRPLFVDLGHLDPKSIRRGVATAEGGRFALANYRYALTLARARRAQAVCFTPFNKQAMRLALSSYDDEIGFTAEVIGADAPASEFNILDTLWNARVTSHIPLRKLSLMSLNRRCCAPSD
jgi:4-hydroxythreonine-4-phosphate dehydrogenase